LPSPLTLFPLIAADDYFRIRERVELVSFSDLGLSACSIRKIFRAALTFNTTKISKLNVFGPIYHWLSHLPSLFRLTTLYFYIWFQGQMVSLLFNKGEPQPKSKFLLYHSKRPSV